MSTIEATKLDGGACKGEKSINQMKSAGWSIEDIKITPKNNSYDFIYILKKASTKSNFTSTQNLSDEELEKKIIKRLEAKKIQEKKEKELEEKILAKKKGKELYNSKCSSCHGSKGEKKASSKSLVLRDMSLKSIKFAIAQYTNSYEYGKGQQFMMKPYASNTNSKELEMMYSYLKEIN